MTRRLQIAVVKPDWGIRGGFELVVDRVVSRLVDSGHDVRVLSYDAWASDHRPFGCRIPERSWAKAPEYFTYLSQLEACHRLDIHSADLVVSTQPPSFAVEHPRHLSLFFHHLRMFYDLSPYVGEAGLVDPSVHGEASTSVRRIDAEAISRVKHFAAGSETVASRLVEFNARTEGVSLFHAGPSLEGADSDEANPTRGHVLCVSRHDFPKRTELFVHAASLAPDLRAVAVGTGGRLGFARQLANRLATTREAPDTDSKSLWCRSAPWIDPSTVEMIDLNLQFAGAVSDAELDRLYRQATCVVAPALLEDYGLTVIEAMRYGKPVIVCRDGGHLRELVTDGVTGLVVDPTGQAIADAMRHLNENHALAKSIGARAREFAREFTWERAMSEFDSAIEATLS
jgi:glycosyltransferase involved in cell wall biosynthesis